MSTILGFHYVLSDENLCFKLTVGVVHPLVCNSEQPSDSEVEPVFNNAGICLQCEDDDKPLMLETLGWLSPSMFQDVSGCVRMFQDVLGCSGADVDQVQMETINTTSYPHSRGFNWTLTIPVPWGTSYN